jgi:hypothetical protein
LRSSGLSQWRGRNVGCRKTSEANSVRGSGHKFEDHLRVRVTAGDAVARSDFELDTTIRKVFAGRGQLPFERSKTIGDRLLELTLPLLWLLVAVVVLAALW